jgi:hypothetical protein
LEAVEMDEQSLVSAYEQVGFSLWESDGGEEIYGFRSGFRRFQVTDASHKNPPRDWDQPVVLQYFHEKDFTAWRKEFPSSREFFAYWSSAEAQH